MSKNLEPPIDFTMIIRIVRNDGTICENAVCANHTGCNPTQETIESTINLYHKQIDAMKTGDVYIDRGYEKIYVKEVKINKGHQYLS